MAHPVQLLSFQWVTQFRIACLATLDACKTSKAVFTLQVLPDSHTVRERYASGSPCTHCVGFVWYTQTTSGGVLSGRERYASCCRCSVNARVDASGTAATRRLHMSADWPIYFHSINFLAANRVKNHSLRNWSSFWRRCLTRCWCLLRRTFVNAAPLRCMPQM